MKYKSIKLESFKAHSILTNRRLSLLLLTLTLLICIVPFTSASLGVYKSGDCVQIKTILNATSVNISTISYPNSTLAISNQAMSKNGLTFNYTFCSTATLGNYIYDYFDDEGQVYVNDFTISYDGNSLNISNSVLYIGLIAILILLFVLVVISIPKLPSSNNTNDEGLIMSINNLKYLKPVLYACAWGLLLGIIFITSNISIAYLPTSLFGSFFFMLYKVMFVMTFPIILICIVYMFAKIFQDREIKRLIERGVEIRSTP